MDEGEVRAAPVAGMRRDAPLDPARRRRRVRRAWCAVLAIGALGEGRAAAAPDYAVVRRSAEASRPAQQAWAAIGGFCRIGELLSVACEIVGGDGGVGTLRRLNGNTVEAEVGRTPLSYTYSQIEGVRQGLDYHGTFAVEPIDAARSRITYTIVLDLARLPSSTDKADYVKQLGERFEGVVERAKAMAEKR